jgi:hypothetical protein
MTKLSLERKPSYVSSAGMMLIQRSLINVLKAANQPVPEELLKFGTAVKKKGHDAYGAFFRDVDVTKTATKIKFD